MNLLRALRHRAFALLWSGQTISRVGDSLYEVALAWWVLQETGSALAMGSILVFSLVPMLLFLLIGGAMGDRLPRVGLMLGSDVIRGAAMIGVTALAWADQLVLWHVYLASLLFGLLDAFSQPAYAALVPDVTPNEDLPSANALGSFSHQFGRVAGPAMAGGMLVWGGTSAAFGLNALSFLVSGLFLLPLLGRFRRPTSAGTEGVEGVEAPTATNLVAEVRAGLALVYRYPILWISILVFAFANITLAAPFGVALPFLVQEHLGGDERLLGLLYATFPVGYILGGIWGGRQQRLTQRGPLSYLCLAVAGLCIALLGLRVPLPIILAAAVINGVALEICNLCWLNIVQEVVPGEMMGRVSSIDMLGSFIFLPIGYGLVGVATDTIGPATVFVLGGVITVGLAFLALAHPAIRRFS